MGRCSSKAFGVPWDSLGGLCNHTILSAKTQLSLHSILHAASSLGMTGSTMVQVLVWASSDEIIFLRGHASSLGAGLGLWADVRLQLALPSALCLFVPFPLTSG